MKPILFTAENRQRTRTGHKTQTRRVVDAPTSRARFDGIDSEGNHWWEVVDDNGTATERYFIWKAPYTIGDILYLPEPYVIDRAEHTTERQIIGEYLDDGLPFCITLTPAEWDRWTARKQPYAPTQARFMYKSLARTFVQISGLRLQPLQEISKEDAIAEGLVQWVSPSKRTHYGITHSDVWELDPRKTFIRLWDSIHNHYTWESNPTVLAITYQLTDHPIPSPQSPVPSSPHNKRL